MYTVYIWFWPTLHMCVKKQRREMLARAPQCVPQSSVAVTVTDRNYLVKAALVFIVFESAWTRITNETSF
jgi:hypothetical protein